ncbi:hypothetical protein EV421DRAFT_336191 [Armillaria borealis]|uniref:Secreted protein n=1 Tax=Armillaria borealis TaxID=47425 RepID=A0AA39IVV3_9AGAR|nr:hypothetical protein EV421DRAFT_336191 [Armillaria borealis]
MLWRLSLVTLTALMSHSRPAIGEVLGRLLAVSLTPIPALSLINNNIQPNALVMWVFPSRLNILVFRGVVCGAPGISASFRLMTELRPTSSVMLSVVSRKFSVTFQTASADIRLCRTR